MLLLAAGTLSALVYFALFHGSLIGGGEPIALAESIAKHHRFADPFSANGHTGPTAHLAPLLPVLFAVWYQLLGKAAPFALVVCAALAQGVLATLLPRLSEQVFARSRPGMIAAVCTIALPVYALEPVWENMYCAAGLLALCVVFSRLRGVADAAKCGMAAGLLLLLSPSLLFVIIFWWAYLFWLSWTGAQRFSRMAVTCCMTCVLVLLPWEIRNFRQLGGFVFVRDNFGLELYVANNDCARATLVENLESGCYQRMHPMFSTKELQDVNRLGELRYNRDRGQQALRWISEHPARFWALVRDRFLYFWFPPEHFLPLLITCLSVVGLAFLFIQGHRIVWFAIATLAVYPLPYYVVQASERFRYPVMWINLLLAGYALDRLYEEARKWKKPPGCFHTQVAVAGQKKE